MEMQPFQEGEEVVQEGEYDEGMWAENNQNWEGYDMADQEMVDPEAEEEIIEEIPQEEYPVDGYDQQDYGDYIDPTQQVPQAEENYYFNGDGEGESTNRELVPAVEDELLETQYSRPPQQAAVRRPGDYDNNYDPPNAENNEEYGEKKKKRKFRFSFWVSSVAEEVGFSVWFRTYIYYLLLCHLVFVTTYGANLLLAAEYRILVPPSSPDFFGPMSMLLMFFATLMLITSLIYMGVRLIVAWMGFSPKSCNLFLLPNRVTQSEKRALKWRNYQLLLFELSVFVGPFAYGIITTLGNKQTFYAFIGNFTFSAFVVFESMMAVLYIYFWWVTACRKKSAMRLGSRMRKASKEMERSSDDRYGNNAF